MPTLYVVATPIGNLEDITLRALRVLKEVDLILCEDTRQTRKLLDHYEIKTPTLSYHQHSKLQKTDHILGQLREGKNLALVSDAGTPCVSDPGSKLVDSIAKMTGCQVAIVPIPGPSAMASAVSIAGLNVSKFVFLGFLPHKKGRQKLFREISESPHAVVFYESPHRIAKTLAQLKEVLTGSHKVVICRELTKKFESIYRGTIDEVSRQLAEGTAKGEFAVVIKKDTKD